MFYTNINMQVSSVYNYGFHANLRNKFTNGLDIRKSDDNPTLKKYPDRKQHSWRFLISNAAEYLKNL